MLFINGSTGIVIEYISGTRDQVKNFVDINSIINSLTFKSNSQGTGSSGVGNVKNAIPSSKQTPIPNITSHN